MATQFPFGVGQNDSHGAELIRRMIGIEYSSIGGVGGKASDNHLQVVQHGAGAMSVDVYAGECVIPGSLATWQGKYYGLNDATISGLAISASNGARLLDCEAQCIGAGRFGLARALVDIGGFHARRHDAEPREQIAATGR